MQVQPIHGSAVAFSAFHQQSMQEDVSRRTGYADPSNLGASFGVSNSMKSCLLLAGGQAAWSSAAFLISNAQGAR